MMVSEHIHQIIALLQPEKEWVENAFKKMELSKGDFFIKQGGLAP
jgi:hypothetical protein